MIGHGTSENPWGYGYVECGILDLAPPCASTATGAKCLCRLMKPSGPPPPTPSFGYYWEAPCSPLDHLENSFSGGGGVHRNTARQAMDGLWTEVCGQQKQSNDPGNNQHILNTPIIGRR